MKPFRGKPEKPERSKGEIQPRLGRSAPRGRATAGSRPRRAVRLRPVSNACTSPLVGRRDPLGVGLRSGRADRPDGLPSASDPRHPAGSLDGRTMWRWVARLRARVRPAASSTANSKARTWSGPEPVRLWRRSPRTDPFAGRRRYCFGYFQDPS